MKKGDPAKQPENTLYDILVALSQPPKVKTKDQLVQHFQIMDKMMILELDYLKGTPDMLYVGMTKQKDEKEPDIVKIKFVPCIVRPETLLLGFNKN